MQNIYDRLAALPIVRAANDPHALDISVRLHAGSQYVDLIFEQGVMRLQDPEHAGTPLQVEHPELIVYFSSEGLLEAVLKGETPLIAAVMSGDVRSSGYIVWVFRLLRALTQSD